MLPRSQSKHCAQTRWSKLQRRGEERGEGGEEEREGEKREGRRGREGEGEGGGGEGGGQ